MSFLTKNPKGFTLIEILVSLSILSIAVVSIVMLFSGGLRSIKASGDNFNMVLAASNEIKEILAKESLEEMEDSKDYGDMVIERTVKEVESEKSELLPLRLYEIIVRVKKGEKTYTLKTRKVLSR